MFTVKRLLAVALVAAGCADSGRPERVGPDVPTFAAEAANIALYEFNGTIPQNGTALIKEFNPSNPPLGSTIVATFVWRGSTNIITSVTDYLWTGKQVGNTYRLVEYVTAGGFSMATYVATNAQNYPDPKQVLGEELVVQATLATSVSAGGVLVSAYTGVSPVFEQAVGAHHSAAGSGSVFTTADPGAIAIGAGALAYGVSLSSDGLVGMDPPTGFTKLTTLSDQSMQFDAEYALPQAGSVDPRWTWSFHSPSTWLASVLALNPASGASSGSLTVTTNTSGPGQDPDGFTVTLDGVDSRSIATTDSVTFTGLAAGSHTVVLSGVAPTCTVNGDSSRTVTVPSGGTVVATYAVSCSAETGSLAVAASTTGSNLDPDGYTVTVDGNQAQAITTNGNVTFPNLAAGSHTVVLSGVATNCAVAGGTSRSVTVPSGGSGSTTFAVSCASGGGIVLDQRNGTLNANGTALLKGFNPTNPHRGAAIVATFFWLGSTNIITSVTDHLTDGTPVGNAYTLVEYVTGSGISMATYVATNVQNFPDPNPDQNKVLVVQANLSSSITDGGIMLSAYGGVNSVSAQAVGTHRSASGSGSTVTTAAPGAIAVNAGALVYGVTMSNRAAGIDPPGGFTNITTISDAAIEADGEYAVSAGAGSVGPQWNWYFNAPSAWLATVLALNPGP